jgi:acetyl-CoA carboxylase biotin carboxyl carrier protein
MKKNSEKNNPQIATEEILELLAMANQQDLRSFKLKKENFTLEFERGNPVYIQPQQQQETQVQQILSQPVVTVPHTPPVAPTIPSNITVISSPISGTFYTSPSPDAPLFVKVGDRVSTGQTLCIVEAMKHMNEIQSEENGVIVEILVENQTPVSQGQALFHLKA